MNADGATPQVAQPEDLTPLFAAFDPRWPSVTPEEKWKADEAALRVENPILHRKTDAIDCVGCHTATSLRVGAERGGFAARPSEARYVPSSAATTALKSRAMDKWSVTFINFGYLRADTSISQRTVNTTAAIVDALRK